ncbi:MAG: type IV pili methyl-accepting chemotaxis transducer N-terminal domain-containing protein [Desulfurispora sp.]|uniref:type IV pili methyl-accepting chemotaxis transducer N-terminal domain-containing protein n=1 Tax=Desulfurispora sp. TaxID=3014275 RepID=UPI00404B91FD
MLNLSVRMKLLLPMLIILLLTVGQIYLIQHMNQVQQAGTVQVNLAGRQRMLSQKMSKETLAYALTGDGQYLKARDETMATLEKSLVVLQQGGRIALSGREVSVAPPPASEIKQALDEAARYWQSVKPLYTGVERQSDPKAASQALLPVSVELLQRFERITGLYEKSSAAVVGRSMAFIYACLAVYFVLVGVAAYLIQTRVVRPLLYLRDAAARIARGDLSD